MAQSKISGYVFCNYSFIYILPKAFLNVFYNFILDCVFYRSKFFIQCQILKKDICYSDCGFNDLNTIEIFRVVFIFFFYRAWAVRCPWACLRPNVSHYFAPEARLILSRQTRVWTFSGNDERVCKLANETTFWIPKIL